MEKHILVIDDEEAIRKLFRRVIETRDRHIHSAASGAEALELLEQQPMDLILLDLNMPGMDGADTLVTIRKTHPTVPVFIVSGFGDAYRDRLGALREAGIEFATINKPVDKERLRAVVNNVLAESAPR